MGSAVVRWWRFLRPPNAFASSTRRGADQARARIDPADTLIITVGNVEASKSVGGDTVGVAKLGAGSGASIPRVALASGAGYAVNKPSDNIDASGAVVFSVCDVDVADLVDGDTRGKTKLGADCISAIARFAIAAISGNSSDCARVCIDAADAVVTGVSDIEGFEAADRDAKGKIQFSTGGISAITGVALATSPGDSRDSAANTIKA